MPPAGERDEWSARDTAACLLCGLAPLAAYLATLSPTVNGGDSGELITVAHVLGVAHPPGYPLHTLLARLFTFLPLGGAAERVNLLSALCDAGAAAFLCAAVRLWTGHSVAGVFAAGTFALSPLVWAYAIETEVFPLNNLFVAGLLLLSAWIARAPGLDRTLAWASAFWLGLGLANHHTLVLFGLPFMAWLFARDWPRTASPRLVGGMAAAFALGLLPYLYLPWAAARIPRVSWGEAASWHGFLAHLLRREYGTFRLAGEGTGAGGQLLANVLLFARSAGEAVFGVGLLLLLPALLVLRRRGPARSLTALWLGALAFYLAVFCSLANLRLDDALHVRMQARFWQQPLVAVCALLGLGLLEATRSLPASAAGRVRWALALGLPLGLAFTHLPEMRRHGNRVVRDYGEALLRSVPADSLLVISSDEAVGSVLYVQHVEGLQPGTRVVAAGQFTSPWFRAYASKRWPDLALPPDHPGARERGEAAFSFRELLDANRGRFPVFVCNRVPWMQTLEEAYTLWPAGLVERVRPKGEEPKLNALVAEAESSFARIDVAPAQSFPAGTWERGIADAYGKLYGRLGFAVAGLASRRRDDPAAAEAVVRVFEALARQPAPPPAVFKNLGVAYRELAGTRPDAAAKMAAAWRRYLTVAPPGDADVPNIRKLLEQEEAAALAGRATTRE